jgi:hypothetical protein
MRMGHGCLDIPPRLAGQYRPRGKKPGGGVAASAAFATGVLETGSSAAATAKLTRVIDFHASMYTRGWQQVLRQGNDPDTELDTAANGMDQMFTAWSGVEAPGATTASTGTPGPGRRTRQAWIGGSSASDCPRCCPRRGPIASASSWRVPLSKMHVRPVPASRRSRCLRVLPR